MLSDTQAASSRSSYCSQLAGPNKFLPWLYDLFLGQYIHGKCILTKKCQKCSVSFSSPLSFEMSLNQKKELVQKKEFGVKNVCFSLHPHNYPFSFLKLQKWHVEYTVIFEDSNNIDIKELKTMFLPTILSSILTLFPKVITLKIWCVFLSSIYL